MTTVQPRLRMFAGPNGSGKSTINEVLPPQLLGICASLWPVGPSQIVALSPTINGARYAHHFWHYRAQLLLGFRLG